MSTRRGLRCPVSEGAAHWETPLGRGYLAPSLQTLCVSPSCPHGFAGLLSVTGGTTHQPYGTVCLLRAMTLLLHVPGQLWGSQQVSMQFLFVSQMCFSQMWLKAEASCNIHECPPRGLKNGCTCTASMCGGRALLPRGLQPLPAQLALTL